MSIIIFIIILGALIFVHELGHFLLAKKNGIRVDEFAIGFPPRLYSVQRGETQYSLNLIPFGGYVKIFGENPDDESLDPNRTDSFINKSRWIQAAVLVAGVVFNVVFAWFLFFVISMTGAPAVVTSENSAYVTNPQLVITDIFKDSPAERAGLVIGDVIQKISNQKESFAGAELNPEVVKKIISESNGVVSMELADRKLEIDPQTGILGDTRAIGISMEKIGVQNLTFWQAIPESLRMTRDSFKTVFTGLISMISGKVSLKQVSGPIGIVGMVGSAAKFGLANLLAFTAVLSINLAVLNILPFPALDGGRLLFLGIEGITRRRIKPVIANWVNAIGFLILIGFMILITVSDVMKLF